MFYRLEPHISLLSARLLDGPVSGTFKSTLAKYLQLIGPLPEGSMFPNECRQYLAGVVGRGAQLKFLLRAGMLPLGRLESRKRR
jgi:hypothetical protein